MTTTHPMSRWRAALLIASVVPIAAASFRIALTEPGMSGAEHVIAASDADEQDDAVKITVMPSANSERSPTFFWGRLAESGENALVIALDQGVFCAYDAGSGCLLRIWQGTIEMTADESGAPSLLAALGKGLALGRGQGCWEVPGGLRAPANVLRSVTVSDSSATLTFAVEPGAYVVSETISLVLGPEALRAWLGLVDVAESEEADEMLSRVGLIVRRFDSGATEPFGLLLHWNRPIESMWSLVGFEMVRKASGHPGLDLERFEPFVLHGPGGELEIWQVFELPGSSKDR